MRWAVSYALVWVIFVACTTVRAERTEAEIPIAPPNAGPVLRILGIAQDGGLPHAGCSCPRCDAATTDIKRASHVASVAVLIPSEKQGYLIDATPDIIPQLALLRDVRGQIDEAVNRKPVDGIFLTHAHMGHYLGLAHLGFETVSTKNIPLWCSPRMADFLTGNAPWNRLVSEKHVQLNPTLANVDIILPGGVQVTPLEVPHRAEYTDTYGFYIRGPDKRALYIPDTSPWHAWKTSAEEIFTNVDIALIDGTFYSGDELPGRDISQIGHPLIIDSMDMLQARVDAGTLEVYFIHLNHSNPALDPDSDERKVIEARGFHVGHTGLDLPL